VISQSANIQRGARRQELDGDNYMDTLQYSPENFNANLMA